MTTSRQLRWWPFVFAWMLMPSPPGRVSPASAAAPNALAGYPKHQTKCSATVRYCIGITAHVVVTDGRPVQPPKWFHRQIREANRHFAPLDLQFELATVHPLPAESFHVHTRLERDLLGRTRFKKGTAHVFVVGHLDNVDEPGEIYGVHWRDRANIRRRWIILASISSKGVLAHELGHFFSAKHSRYPISIMNKKWRSTPKPSERTFAPQEIRIMKKALARMLAKGFLVNRRHAQRP